ncbi:glycoside hydrolase superfamily, partial [Lipomyces oligophaga]|uniref:glycoside hydrolase superfamily n=1 Tax=Lipomyces oligophaga TaxID=45792 RepID=UPI0034CEE9E7
MGLQLYFLSILVLCLRLATAYDSGSSNNVAVYWGQASAGSQERLSSYCQDSVDIVILAFLTTFFSSDDLPEINFASACSDTFSGTSLLECDTIAEDIKTCQSAGKKVLLSLGGASGSYGFTGDDQAIEFADTLWSIFGAGSGAEYRPFGDAIVDGFDLDIENGNSVGYAAFATQMRNNYNGGDYYLSAAPQCPFPDASIGDALDNAWFDFVFIQFYNNYCAVTAPDQFNYDSDWMGWLSGTSLNRDAKLFVGVPGSSSAAGSGYATPSELQTVVSAISDKSALGGVMIWDASQCTQNMIDGASFVSAVKDMLSDIDSTAATSSVSSSVESVTSSSASTSLFIPVETSLAQVMSVSDMALKSSLAAVDLYAVSEVT